MASELRDRTPDERAFSFLTPFLALSLRSSGLARCIPAARFGRQLLLAARALVVRAVFQSVWCHDLQPGLLVVERLTGLVSRRDLLFRAVAEGDLFSWHKDHLPDRHAV